jgi:hypothetical protein
VAFALLDGPHTIFPPPPRHGTLELDLVFRFVSGEYPRDCRSVALYCDGTVNKHSGFHEPLVRVAIWKRREEPDNIRFWPAVSVEWGWLRSGKRRIGDFIRRLTRQLQRPPVVADGGVFTRNGRPPVILDDKSDRFTLLVKTRLQSIELSTPAIRDDTLRALASKGASLLEELMVPFDFKGCTECYDKDLSSLKLVSASHWRWNGKVLRSRD